MSYMALRVLELAHLEKQNRVFMARLGAGLTRDGYNAAMLRVFAQRLLSGDY